MVIFHSYVKLPEGNSVSTTVFAEPPGLFRIIFKPKVEKSFLYIHLTYSKNTYVVRIFPVTLF